MLGNFFRNNSKLEEAVTKIASSLEVCFKDVMNANNGVLPTNFQFDNYILGYISGVTFTGAIVFKIKDSDKDLLLEKILKCLFYNEHKNVFTTMRKQIDNKLLIKGMESGMEEYYTACNVVFRNDEEAIKKVAKDGILPSIEKYISDNYL